MSSASDRSSWKAPGAAICVTTISDAPPSPAQAALTTKATTCALATLMPAS